jgi:hypothetical protein
MRSLTCLMPTRWPAKTVLRLIFSRLKQIRPHVVTVTIRNGPAHSGASVRFL